MTGALNTLDSVDIEELQELVDNTTQVTNNISDLLQEELEQFGKLFITDG